MTMRGEGMDTNRGTARVVGVLFIIGFTGGFLPIYIRPLLDDPNYLSKLAENKSLVTTGVLAQVIMALACAAIAIWLYPVLRKYNESLALGAVGFRLIENVFQMVAALGLLSLLTLGQEAVKAGDTSTSAYQAMGTSLLALRFWAAQVLSQFGWVIGAFMYYCIFYQSKLIPRWLSSWGLIAMTLHLVGVFFVLFLQVDPFSKMPLTLLSLPIGLQELVLAVWLIVKGFNPAAIASNSAKVNIG